MEIRSRRTANEKAMLLLSVVNGTPLAGEHGRKRSVDGPDGGHVNPGIGVSG